jgi:hypothetical protein
VQRRSPSLKASWLFFESFFVADLRLPAHRFVAEVLQRFKVQVHQLTPNVVVALAKYVWAVTSYGEHHLWRSSPRIIACIGIRGR